MIQQSTQQPLCDQPSQCSGNGVGRSWLGHGVGVTQSFVGSLIPKGDPCLTIDPHKALLDISRLSRLAVATVLPVILPASTIIFMVKDIADSCSGSRLPGPGATPELPQASKETREAAQENQPGRKKISLQHQSTARYQGNQGAKGLFGLGTLVSTVLCADSSSIPHETTNDTKPVFINDAETLGKIGQGDYPMDGNYQLTADIDASHHQSIGSIGSDTRRFTGQLDGQCHTISKLSECLIKEQGPGSSISNLRFTDANIKSTEPAGLVACKVNGTVSYIRAENVHISTSGNETYAGIGDGEVQSGRTVANTTAVDSTVKTSDRYAHAGIGGVIGTVANTTAVNSTVNGNITDMGSISNDQLSTLCQNADPRVLTAGCHSRSVFLDVTGFSHSDICPVNETTASTAVATASTAAATASTAAATAGIIIGSLVGAGALGIVVYSTYQWMTGYRAGLRDQELVMKPFTRGR